MGGLVCVIVFFFSQTFGDIIFSVIYKAIPLQEFFFARNQSAGYFFGNHP